LETGWSGIETDISAYLYCRSFPTVHAENMYDVTHAPNVVSLQINLI